MSVCHINSEGEMVAIEDRQLRGEKCRCLVIYDDPPPRGSGRPAPMLLDEGTRRWLLAQLSDGPSWSLSPTPTAGEGD